MSEINFPNFNTLLTSRELQAKTIYDLFRHLKDVEKDSEAYNALRQEVQELCDEIRGLDPSMSEEEAIQALAAKQAIVEADLSALGPKIGQMEEALIEDISELTGTVLEDVYINSNNGKTTASSSGQVHTTFVDLTALDVDVIIANAANRASIDVIAFWDTTDYENITSSNLVERVLKPAGSPYIYARYVLYIPDRAKMVSISDNYPDNASETRYIKGIKLNRDLAKKKDLLAYVKESELYVSTQTELGEPVHQGWIRHSDQQWFSSSAFRTYAVQIPDNAVKMLVSTTPALDTAPNVITFYRNSPTSSTSATLYVDSVVNVIGQYSYEADIPKGAKYACITARSAEIVPTAEFFAIRFQQNTTELVAQLAEDVNSVKSMIIKDALHSTYFDDPSLSWDGAVKRFVLMNQSNAAYRNKRIIGLEFIAQNAGEIEIVKASIVNNAAMSNYEVIKTATITAGYNYVELDSPCVITSSIEYIGINSNDSTQKLRYKSIYDASGICFFWENSSGIMNFSTKQFVVGIRYSTIGDFVGVEEFSKEIDGLRKLEHQAWLDYPYYYHYQPNGFVNGIPSQSVEDNMLAKRLGFKFVEVNSHQTATTGKHIVTHGASGTFGDEFNSTYKDVAISSMSYDNIVANVKYNSPYACYNHTISTAEAFFKNCAQLGLGVYLREDNGALIALCRKYIQDEMIVMVCGANVRDTYNFKGMLTQYLGSTDYATICDVDYLRDYANARGGAPFHFVLNGGAVDYMEQQGILNDVVGTLRAEGIYFGVCYSTAVQAEKLTAAGGCGHAATLGLCNPMNEPANYAAYSTLDSDLSGWTIPQGVTNDGGRLVNGTSSDVTIITPSTDVMPLAKGQVEARVKGTVSFSLGEVTNQTYTDYDENTPIVLCIAGFNKDMRLTVKIAANSSVEFLNYQVSRC